MKISRRTFLKFLAAGAGGASAFLLSPLPWQGVGRFVRASQPGPVFLHKGKEEKRQAVLCTAHNPVPVQIRMVDGIARQTLSMEDSAGKTTHPLGGRGTIGLAAAEIQNLARPSRLTKPLMRENGMLVEISWERALDVLRKKLSFAGNSIACVSGEPGSVGAALLNKLLQESGSFDFFPLPGQRTTLRQAFQMLGIDREPAYDISESHCTLSVGADWLESWGPSYYWRNKIFENYDPAGSPDILIERSEAYPTHIYCGGYNNATARYADSWLALKPGDEELFLLTLGHGLLTRMGHILSARPNTPGKEYFDAFSEIFADYPADEIGVQIGIEPAVIARIASQLVYSPRPLVITGSAIGVDQSPVVHMLGFCLNLMLGNCFNRGGFYLLPPIASTATRPDFAAWLEAIAEAKEARPDLIFIHECNPAYTLPTRTEADSAKGQKILESIPFKVALAIYENETTGLCDLVLPISAALERWDQVYSPLGARGYFSIEPPAILPPPEIPGVANLLSALEGVNFSTLSFSAPHPQEQAVFQKSCANALIDAGKALQANELLVHTRGSFNLHIPPVHLLKEILCDKKNLLMGDYRLEKRGLGLRLVPMAFHEHMNFCMGLSSFRAWPLFKRACTAGSINRAVAWLNPAEAKRQRLSPGDKILITAPLREIKMVVGLDPDLAEGCVGLYAGFGHQGGDQFSKGIGENLFKLYELARGTRTGLSYYRQMPFKLQKDD